MEDSKHLQRNCLEVKHWAKQLLDPSTPLNEKQAILTAIESRMDTLCISLVELTMKDKFTHGRTICEKYGPSSSDSSSDS